MRSVDCWVHLQPSTSCASPRMGRCVARMGKSKHGDFPLLYKIRFSYGVQCQTESKYSIEMGKLLNANPCCITYDGHFAAVGPH